MVGRVMEALDRNQMAENTLFIMTSDNGAEWDPPHIEEFGHHANHPDLRGKKRDAWDGGHRIPFIAAGRKRSPRERPAAKSSV